MNSQAENSSRRQIVVFGLPQSDAVNDIERSVDFLRCELVDRDTDVRFVDVSELADAGTISIDETPGALQRLRSASLPLFEIVLLGKDGGIKARSDNPRALEEFLALIDTMPMRRAEIRTRGGADSDCGVG